MDSEASGHHVVLHARYVFADMISRGWRPVWLTSRHALEHPASAAILAEFGDDLRVVPAEFPRMPMKVGGGQWIAYEWMQYFVLKRGLARLKARYPIHAVYLAWMDCFPRVMGLLGVPFPRLRYSGLLMHPRFHLEGEKRETRLRALFSTQAWSKKLLENRDVERIGILDEFAYEWIKKTKPPGWDRVSYVPDLGGLNKTADREYARKTVGAGKEDIVLLLYGAVTEKKGLAPLLDGLAGFSGDIVLLIAGRVDPTQHTVLESRKSMFEGGSIRLSSGTDFSMTTMRRAVFSAADIVWMGYRGVMGSSGVQLLAASAGVPTISCDQGVIGEMARRHELGPVVDVTNAAEVAQAIAVLCDGAQRSFYSVNGTKLAKKHNPRCGASVICDMIQVCLDGRGTKG